MPDGTDPRPEGRPEAPEQLLTTEQVAEWLNLPADTIRWWRKRNRGPGYVRIGRFARYIRQDVEDWLRDQRVR